MMPLSYELKRIIAQHRHRLWCATELGELPAAPVYCFRIKKSSTPRRSIRSRAGSRPRPCCYPMTRYCLKWRILVLVCNLRSPSSNGSKRGCCFSVLALPCAPTVDGRTLPCLVSWGWHRRGGIQSAPGIGGGCESVRPGADWYRLALTRPAVTACRCRRNGIPSHPPSEACPCGRFGLDMASRRHRPLSYPHRCSTTRWYAREPALAYPPRTLAAAHRWPPRLRASLRSGRCDKRRRYEGLSACR